MISGTVETTIAASDDATWRSPRAIIGNGIEISGMAKATSQRQRPRRLGSTPARHAITPTMIAASAMRTHARKSAGVPPSSAMRMKRYGIPQSTETAANASHARGVTPRLSHF